jgi:hypothetical protein
MQRLPKIYHSVPDPEDKTGQTHLEKALPISINFIALLYSVKASSMSSPWPEYPGLLGPEEGMDITSSKSLNHRLSC